MKKKLFIILGMTVGLAGLAAGIHSCAIDEESGRDKSGVDATVMKARTFFEHEVGAPSLPDTHYKAGGNSPATRSNETDSLLVNAIEPDWDRARVWEEGQITGTEIAARLTRPVNYTTIVEKRDDTVSLTAQSPYVWILFNENKETGETICFLATILPDESYEGDPALLGANPEGSDYWGLAIYSDPDGTPLWGYRFEEGNIVNTLIFDEEDEGEDDSSVRIRMGIASETATRSWVVITFPDGGLYMYQIDDIRVVHYKDDISTIKDRNISPSYEGGSNGISTDRGGGGKPTTPDDNDDDEDEEEKGDDKAKELFESDDLTEEQWKELERMLEEIMIDCMGGKLYNALTAIGQFPIEFDFSRKNSVFRTDGSFALKDYNSDVLFHEMFHALQFHQETSLTSFDGSIPNQEIEAYIAQYRFLQNISPFSWEAMEQLKRYEHGFLATIAGMSDKMISRSGTSLMMDPIDFELRYLGAANYIKNYYKKERDTEVEIDLDRSFEQNFKNLANLTINCL